MLRSIGAALREMRDTRKQTGEDTSDDYIIIGIFDEIFQCLQDREKGLGRSHI
jgi:hypothetical protein